MTQLWIPQYAENWSATAKFAFCFVSCFLETTPGSAGSPFGLRKNLWDLLVRDFFRIGLMRFPSPSHCTEGMCEKLIPSHKYLDLFNASKMFYLSIYFTALCCSASLTLHVILAERALVLTGSDVSLSTCLFGCRTVLPWICISGLDMLFTVKSSTTIQAILMKMHSVSRLCISEIILWF